MSKKLLVFVLLAAFLLISSPPVHSQSSPQFVPLNADLGLSLNSTDPVVLFLGWGVCRAPGLIHAYQNAATYVININDQMIFDGTDSLDYWTEIENWGEVTACNNHSSDFYHAFWAIDIGAMPVGDYTIVTAITLAHQVTDLYDIEHWNGDTWVDVDGKPDKYGPGTDTYTITIHVVE